MYVIRITTPIVAPIERCFDLARSIDAHVHSTEGTSERPIAGRTSGLIEAGEQVTWEAVHFGVRQKMTVQITQMDRPTRFHDRMLKGAFKSFEHEHAFASQPDGSTHMIDELRIEAPLGPLGWIAERLFLGRYMRRFLQTRAHALKVLAESEHWRQYVPAAPEPAATPLD